MNTLSSSRLLLVAGFVLLAGHGVADTSILRGPVLGYVFDARAESIRPVNGIPGSAHLGQSLVLPFRIASAVVSSRGDFALVVSAEDHGLYLVRDLGAPSVAPIPGALTAPGRIVLNVANSAAVLYSAETRRLQVVRGLPDGATAGPLVDLSSLTGNVTALALGADASAVLVALSDGTQGALYRLRVPGDGEPESLLDPDARFLSNFLNPSALAWLNQERDAVLADGGSSQLFLIRDVLGDAAVFLLASERDGIRNPVGVEASADSRKVFVANGGLPGTLAVLDLDTNLIEIKATVDGAPTRLDRMQARSTFLLNEVGDDPLLLLDNAEALEVYFVPAGRDE